MKLFYTGTVAEREGERRMRLFSGSANREKKVKSVDHRDLDDAGHARLSGTETGSYLENYIRKYFRSPCCLTDLFMCPSPPRIPCFRSTFCSATPPPHSSTAAIDRGRLEFRSCSETVALIFLARWYPEEFSFFKHWNRFFLRRLRCSQDFIYPLHLRFRSFLPFCSRV